MSILIANSTVLAAHNLRAKHNVINKAYVVVHGLQVNAAFIQLTVTISQARQALTTVCDFFITDLPQFDVIFGECWTSLCSEINGASFQL